MIFGQKCSPEELVAGKFGNPTLLTMHKNEINTSFFSTDTSTYVAFTVSHYSPNLILTVHNLHIYDN